MNQNVREKLEHIDRITKEDAEYVRMLQKCGELEKQLDGLIRDLPDTCQDQIWDLIMLCETMNRHALILACTYMEFPQKGE